MKGSGEGRVTSRGEVPRTTVDVDDAIGRRHGVRGWKAAGEEGSVVVETASDKGGGDDVGRERDM